MEFTKQKLADLQSIASACFIASKTESTARICDKFRNYFVAVTEPYNQGDIRKVYDSFLTLATNYLDNEKITEIKNSMEKD
jgi:hypothetical protein